MKHALVPNAADEASVVSLRHRYVIVVNSKTAGTTLKTVAAHLEREPLATLGKSREEGRAQRTENWLRTPTLSELPADVLREVWFSDRFFRFTTVRNPLTRCWSAWVDKIVGRHPEFRSTFVDQAWMWRTITPDTMLDAFAEFVAALHTSPRLLAADRHWAPQSRVLHLGLFPYDMVGRTEQLSEVIDRWSAETGLDVASVLEKVGRRNARSLPYPAGLLADTTVNQLCDVYREDLDRLAYDVPLAPTDAQRWLGKAARFLADLPDPGPATPVTVVPPLWQRARQASARTARRAHAHRYARKRPSDPPPVVKG